MFNITEIREACRTIFPDRPIFCTPEMLSQLAFTVPEQYRKQIVVLDLKGESNDVDS